MRVIVSGLSGRASRSVVGEFLWRGHSLEWMDAAVVVDQLHRRVLGADALLVWLYRSPASEAIEAAEGKNGLEEVLAQWSALNRALLNALGADARARLVNVDRIPCGQFPAAVLREAGGLRGDGRGATAAMDGASDPRRKLILHLLGFAAPACIEVFRDLERVAWGAGEITPALEDVAHASKVDIFAMLDIAASSSRSRTRAELENHTDQLRFELFEAKTQLSAVLGENELLLVQLKQLQGDLRARQAGAA